MKVKKLNSDKLVTLNVRKYLIDWNNSGASKIEVKFRDLIRPYWFRSIILYQPRVPGSLLRLDFLNVNKRLCVEIDGSQHGEFNKHFHKNSKNVYLASIKRDLQKEEWCATNDIKMLHLTSEDLDNFSPRWVESMYGISII